MAVAPAASPAAKSSFRVYSLSAARDSAEKCSIRSRCGSGGPHKRARRVDTWLYTNATKTPLMSSVAWMTKYVDGGGRRSTWLPARLKTGMNWAQGGRVRGLQRSGG
ncbi:unnamed protein product [Urochloa humidicola]